MIIKKDIKTTSISWLSTSYKESWGGVIGTLYEPETLDELITLGRKLYAEKRSFDLIGHTSNTYFMPGYSVDTMVSTRRVNKWEEQEDRIICDCGVGMIRLSRLLVEKGIKGFEAFVDLPGTVGSAVYGNAGCCGGLVNELLLYFDILLTSGEIVRLHKDDLKLSHRSTALKRKELQGIIISIALRKEYGDKEKIKQKAEENRARRKRNQPGPVNNLGSIFANSGRRTLLNRVIQYVLKAYELVFLSKNKDREIIQKKKRRIFLKILGAEDLSPYLYDWNRYIWKDDVSHALFWKYVRLHKRLFSGNDFEIEIKENNDTTNIKKVCPNDIKKS